MDLPQCKMTQREVFCQMSELSARYHQSRIGQVLYKAIVIWRPQRARVKVIHNYSVNIRLASLEQLRTRLFELLRGLV